MAKAGRKASKSTVLSMLLHDLKNALLDDDKVLFFTYKVLNNLVTDREGYRPSEDLAAARDSTMLSQYFSGNSCPRDDILTHMLRCLDKTRFVSWFNAAYDENVRKNAALQLQSYDESTKADESNVASLVFDAFRRALNILKNPDCGLQLKIKAGQMPEDTIALIEYRDKFGEKLKQESDFHCEVCGSELIANNGKTEFYPCIIDRTKGASLNNLIPLCHECYQEAMVMHDEERIKMLSQSKKKWLKRSCLRLSDHSEEFISDITRLLNTIKGHENELSSNMLVTEAEIKLVPVNVESKLRDEPFLCRAVRSLATEFYPDVRRALKSESAGNDSQFSERLETSIKAAYLTLEHKKTEETTKEDIFYALVETLRDMTHGSETACTALVAYYVQDCEVFDAIAE